MRNKIIIGCLLLGVLSAKAQDARLSAVEYKERVLEYSRQIKQSSEERIAMQHAIKAAKTGFFPSVDFSGSYQYRINKYDLDFGPGMSVEMDHNTYSLGATVSQHRIIDIKDIIDLLLGNYQGMPQGYRIDIEESKKLIVFRNLVARDLTRHDSTENSCHTSFCF